MIHLLSRAISERFGDGFIPLQGATQVSDYCYCYCITVLPRALTVGLVGHFLAKRERGRQEKEGKKGKGTLRKERRRELAQ